MNKAILFTIVLLLSSCGLMVPSKNQFVKECVADELDKFYVFQRNRSVSEIEQLCALEWDQRFGNG